MPDSLDEIFKDPRVTNLEQEIQLLRKQVTGIQIVLVEAKAVSIAERIAHDRLYKNLDTGEKREITNCLNSAISTLRGVLGEEAIP